ncbi:hypothetical protein HY628_01670 [Candidatus Uhrbacteria bacterium]|nr:hypothetical protein [Candidatus Uhrbacteria bacterium]
MITDTISESATGEDQSSANFLVDAGLPAIFQEPVLLFSLSTGTASFSSSISPNAISTVSYTFTTSTNAPSGYTVQVSEDGNFRAGSADISDVTDGAVSAGSEEYGLSVAGLDAAFSDDRAIPSTSLVVASRSNWISSSITTVTHKAAVTQGFAAGGYAHTVTYVAIGNF